MRRLSVFLLLISLLLLLTLPVSAAEDRIASLTGEIVVDSDGAATVRMTAVVQFGTAPTTFLFPLNSSASNINASGGNYRRTTRNGVQCVEFSNELGYTGTQTFICTYNLPRDASETEDGQSFHIALIEYGWDYPIDKLTVSLTFPAAVVSQPTWNSAYYGDVIDNFLTIELNDTDLVIDSAASLKDHETIEMFLNFPADSFDLDHLPGKTTNFNQIAFYALAALAALYWFFFLRGKLLFAKQQQTAGMEATAGELPCILFGDAPDVAATLAHWGNLGYIAIHRNRRGRIILRKQMDMGNERKPSERKLFEAIFRTGPTCDAQGLRFHTVSKPASAALRSGWLRRIFAPKPGNPYLLRVLVLLAAVFVNLTVFDVLLPAGGVRVLWLILLTLLTTVLTYLVQIAAAAFYRRHRLVRLTAGAAAALILLLLSASAECMSLMLLCLLLQVLAVLLTQFGGRRTEVGQDLVRQNLGLRKYLKKIDRDSVQRLNSLDGQFFYRMLPYAEVMGVGYAFAKHFGQWQPEPCIWLTDASQTPETAMEFYDLYREILNEIRMESYNRILGLPELPMLTVQKRR